MTDPFSTPQKPFARGTGPALRCIGGARKRRLAVIVPFEIVRRERNPFYKDNQPEAYNNQPLRDRMVCDVLLCDGEPFMYGGNDKDIPDTQGPFPVPGVIRGYEIVKQSIIDSIRPTDVGGGVVIGFFHQARTGSGNDAWNFGEAPAEGTPDRRRAAAIFEAYKAGQLPTHIPTEPVANPVQPAFSVPQGNGQPATQVAYNNPYGMHQNPQPMSVPMGGQMTFNAPTTAPAPAVTPGFDFSSIISPQGVATPIDAAPAGSPPEVVAAWPTLSDQQKDMVRQRLAAMAPQSGPGY